MDYAYVGIKFQNVILTRYVITRLTCRAITLAKAGPGNPGMWKAKDLTLDIVANYHLVTHRDGV
jgi:hypothetical protein